MLRGFHQSVHHLPPKWGTIAHHPSPCSPGDLMNARVFWMCCTASALFACDPGDKEGVTGTTEGLDEAILDSDGDGFLASEDCNDGDAAVNAGAVEVCDGVDNDCDGSVDEDVLQEFYADVDGDGFGDVDSVQEGCTQPPGTVPNANDCDDTDAAVFPGAVEVCNGIDDNCSGVIDDGLGGSWYADADGDGFGNADEVTEECDPGVGWVRDNTDCDDSDADAFPGNPEVCDEVDNDCDGDTDEGVQSTFYLDLDRDGWGDPSATTESCAEPAGYATEPGDCDDSEATVHPAATEVCDSIDNDCDGTVDEPDAADALTWYADVDSDGYGALGSPTAACSQPSGHVSDSTDCDDTVFAVNPAATEECDSIDNDCDGTIDEPDAVDAPTWYADVDSDGYGALSASSRACSEPSGYVSDSTDCNDGDSAVNPAATELCDSIDNDCDGSTDEDDASDAATWYADSDSDGYGALSVTSRACSEPSGYVSDSTDCNDADSAVNPAATEMCDSIDNDCDGTVDESDASDVRTWYEDSDSDAFGDVSVTLDACAQPGGYVADATDCDDSDSAVNPAATEVCDSIDNDCDGDIDDDDSSVVGTSTWYADLDGDAYGDSGNDLDACTAPTSYVSDDTDCDDSNTAINPGASEVCNGADDDCNGDIDDGVLGTGAACSAEDCAEILDDDPSATDGYYTLDLGTYYCDMTTDGGGWTLVGTGYVYGTGYSTTYYNTEGFYWDEALFTYNSGSVHAHCTYPGSLTGCNNIGMQFASESWGVAQNWGSSLCGMATTSYTSATTYIGTDWIIDRSGSTDTIRVGTLEGIANCTTADNPGSAYIDIWVRN